MTSKPKRRLFAVVATWTDWSEAIVALYRDQDKASEACRLYAQADKNHKAIRFHVKRASLDADEIAAVVKSWGEADALAGIENPLPKLTNLPEPWRSIYLSGFNSVRR